MLIQMLLRCSGCGGSGGWLPLEALCLFVAVAGLLMDEIKFRPVPEYRPQFVMQEAWEPRGCGGLPDCHTGNLIKRKPTAPSSGVWPLGLAPHVPSSRLFMPLEEWDSAVPVVDFGEDENWNGDSLGAG